MTRFPELGDLAHVALMFMHSFPKLQRMMNCLSLQAFLKGDHLLPAPYEGTHPNLT